MTVPISLAGSASGVAHATEGKPGTLSIRYAAGYSLVWIARQVRRIANGVWRLASLMEQVGATIWSIEDLDHHARFSHWDHPKEVRQYSADAERGEWLNEVENDLVHRHLSSGGVVLNLACGAGREALLLARRGLQVVACDWSPRMIDAARRQAQRASLRISFEVADLYDLPYPDNAFDYLLLTNVAYSYLFPRARRIRFLQRAYALLRPGGVFVVSFAFKREAESPGRRVVARQLLEAVRRWAPSYLEPGDRIASGHLLHSFAPDELRGEFEETGFALREALWDRGYAVFAKD